MYKDIIRRGKSVQIFDHYEEDNWQWKDNYKAERMDYWINKED